LFGCKEQEKNMKIFYFEKGKLIEIKNEKLDLSELNQLLKSMFSNTDDMLKLHVDSLRISQIMKNETGIEITFSEERLFNSKEFGSYKIRKLLIPFTGEFVGNEQSPVITIFAADTKYFSGPLRNSNGFNELNKLRQMIDKAK